MARPKLVFTITADSQQGPRRETRLEAASALRLAWKWAAQGCTTVRVTDQSGTAFETEAFRATLPPVRRMAERRG